MLGEVTQGRSGDLRADTRCRRQYRRRVSSPLCTSVLAATVGPRRLAGSGPRLSPGSVRRCRLTAEYLEKTRGAIDFNRPGIPIIASLPPVYRERLTARLHHGRAGTVAAITEWAQCTMTFL